MTNDFISLAPSINQYCAGHYAQGVYRDALMMVTKGHMQMHLCADCMIVGIDRIADRARGIASS